MEVNKFHWLFFLSFLACVVWPKGLLVLPWSVCMERNMLVCCMLLTLHKSTILMSAEMAMLIFIEVILAE